MKSRKKDKNELKINKRFLINNLVSPIKNDRFFWSKEFKMLNDLLERLPVLTFWDKVQKGIVQFTKVPSLAIHLAEGSVKIKEKYNVHLYESEFKNEQYEIGEKQGNDYHRPKTPKTIKQFLS